MSEAEQQVEQLVKTIKEAKKKVFGPLKDGLMKKYGKQINNLTSLKMKQ